MKDTKDNVIKIADKELGSYITACLCSIIKEENDDIKILARGHNIIKAINVLAILKRDYIDNVSYNVDVGSEVYRLSDGNERNVSTVEITLSGTKKENK